MPSLMPFVLLYIKKAAANKMMQMTTGIINLSNLILSLARSLFDFGFYICPAVFNAFADPVRIIEGPKRYPEKNDTYHDRQYQLVHIASLLS